MRVLFVALLAALALGGVLRLSRASAPPPAPLAAAAALPQAAGIAAPPATPPLAKPEAVRPRVAMADDLPTASIPPEQPKLLKARTHRKAVPIPLPPQRAKLSQRERGKKAAHQHSASALPTRAARR